MAEAGNYRGDTVGHSGIGVTGVPTETAEGGAGQQMAGSKKVGDRQPEGTEKLPGVCMTLEWRGVVCVGKGARERGGGHRVGVLGRIHQKPGDQKANRAGKLELVAGT